MYIVIEIQNRIKGNRNKVISLKSKNVDKRFDKYIEFSICS